MLFSNLFEREEFMILSYPILGAVQESEIA
jgi:hypothetical protein